MAIDFTKDQKNAIKAKGRVLVAAAAGSGKTAVLTERVIRNICNDEKPTSIDRMLIVTFTNASALEMRIRIGKELDKLCKDNPNNSKIHKQKMLLSSAKICTIDSFCIELCRKYFNILGISPDFSIADKSQQAALIEKALKDVLNAHFSDPDDDFKALCDSFEIYSGEKKLHKAIIKIYEFSLCMASPERWLSSAVDNYFKTFIVECPFTKIIFNKARMRLYSLIDKIKQCENLVRDTEFESSWISGLTETRALIDEMIDMCNSSNWDGLLDLSSNFERTKVEKIKNGQNKELHKKIMKIRDNIFEKVTGIASEMGYNSNQLLDELSRIGKQVQTLTMLVREFSEKYFNYLNSKNLLTFALVEQLALKLLCSDTDKGLVPSELSKEICKDYDEVLVDEYQDNNDLQDKLFFAISNEGKHLFMVGDVKQCIYAFRNANPDNFLSHKNQYPLYDGSSSVSKVILKSNFRSRKGVCDFVNGICSQLINNDTCGMEYTDEEVLVADAEFPENAFSNVDLCLTDTSKSKISRDEADAEAVAEYIEKILSEEAFLRVKDSKTEVRKAEFGDFAILLRSPKPRVGFYIEAMKRRGIPVSYEAGEFFDSPEILTAISILKIIDNPTNDIALLSAMTSCAFGYSFDDVAILKSENKGKSLFSRVIKAAAKGDIKSKRMLDILSELRTASVTLQISKLIQKVYNVTFIREILCSKDNSGQVKNNLLTLLRLSSDFESVSDGSLSGFIKHFERLAIEGTVGERSVKSQKNAVSIMSFHGSKGLQFPICIVAGCGNGFNMRDLNDAFITDSEYGISFNCSENGVELNKVAKKALRFAQLQKLIAEEIRLFYVATTRAEERLMVSVTSNKVKEDIIDAYNSISVTSDGEYSVSSDSILSDTGLKRMLLSAAMLQKGNEKLLSISELTPLEASCDGVYSLSYFSLTDLNNEISGEVELKNFIDNCDEKTLELINERFSYRYPFADECNVPSKIAVTELVHNKNNEFAFKTRPRFMSKAGLTPAERGTALHKFMQYCDFNLAENDITAELKRMYEYEFLSEEETESIDTDVVKQFFDGNLYSRIKKSENVMREYKFMVKYPFDGNETIIQGIADCLFEEKDGIVIVDFKTDNITNVEILAERYSEQLKIYKYALGKIFNKPITECILYSVKLGKFINV